MMTLPDYHSISIRADLLERIEAVRKENNYVSAAEFAKDAIRRRLEELEGR